MDVESKATIDASLAEAQAALFALEGKLVSDLTSLVESLDGWTLTIQLPSSIEIVLRKPK
jgi:hypothetical protein